MSESAFMQGEQIDALLTLPSIDAQLEQLSVMGCLNSACLVELLAHAESVVRENPGRARNLASICLAAAVQIGPSDLQPRAQYLLAQAHAMRAEFERALEYIDAACRGYAQSGRQAEALRTQVGRILALSELGRHSEAIDVAIQALADAHSAKADDDLIARLNLNLGACYTEIGRPEDALAALAAAETAYVQSRSPLGAGLVSNNRGVLLLSLGRAREAQHAFQFASQQFAAGDDALESAHAIQNSGYAHILLGEHSAGLAELQRASGLLHALDASADQFVALLDLADGYFGLNLFPEAHSVYREADALLAQAGMSRERARALWGLGASLAAQSYFVDAEIALRQSAELFREAGNLPALIHVMLEEALLLAARRQLPQAIAAARDALALIGERDLPLQAAQAHVRLASWLEPDAGARAHLESARRLAERLALPQLRQQVLAESGLAAMRAGELNAAEAAFTEAVALAERQRAALAQKRMRTAFFSNKSLAYDGLVKLLAQRDGADIRRAFDMSERAKSRTLIDQMSELTDRSRGRGASSEADLRLRALQVRLNECYGALFSGDAEDDAQLAAMQARALALEQDISRLQLQSSVLGSNPDAFGTPLPFERVVQALPARTALLSYYIAGDDILAFVHTADSQGSPPHLVRTGSAAGVAQLLKQLTRQWDRFEHEAQFIARHRAQLERTARGVLANLYDALIRPVEELLHGDSGAEIDVIVLPHGLLHQVPFHALFDGARYWIERATISFAPSATAMALCQQRAPAPGARALVFGVADARIPAVDDEARAIARLLAQPEPQLGDDAGRARFLAEAPGCSVIHLACHGLFRADNPMFSSLKLSDGWLSAANVAALDLGGARVTLSACESGRTQASGGDELLGLTHAFLSAGARSLVVSLWLVHDTTTATLMASYYGQLNAGETPARALRQAQLALKAAWPHPYYWAPFILVGQR